MELGQIPSLLLLLLLLFSQTLIPTPHTPQIWCPSTSADNSMRLEGFWGCWVAEEEELLLPLLLVYHYCRNGQMEGNSGGNDVELLCKTLQVEHKLFYFDLKENPRGRYLKISEKTSATRSTIIVPFSGISWFLDLFNYYVNSDEQDVFSKELQLDTKAFLFLLLFLIFRPCFSIHHPMPILCFQVFYFDIGENRRGRFLKVILFVNFPSLPWLRLLFKTFSFFSFSFLIFFQCIKLSNFELCV